MQRHLLDRRTGRHEVARALFGADQPPLFEQIVRAENRRLTDTALRDDLPERRQPGADRNLPRPDAISDRVGESLVAFHDGFSSNVNPMLGRRRRMSCNVSWHMTTGEAVKTLSVVMQFGEVIGCYGVPLGRKSCCPVASMRLRPRCFAR